MAKKYYNVRIEGVITVEVDDAVLAKAVSLGGDGACYGLQTPEQIVAHLTYNFYEGRDSLPHLDGFADMEHGAFSLVDVDVDYEVENA